MSRRVLAIVTEDLDGPEPLEEIGAAGDEVEVRVVVPAVEASPLRHTLGDIDDPRRRAERRLTDSLRLLRGGGIDASGEVGDPDPVQAAQDALLKAPADEILIFERADTESRWYQEGLFERAQESLLPPLRLVMVESDPGGGDQVVEVEQAGSGTTDLDADKEVGSAYLPGLSRSDFAGMAIGIVGTIAAILLAAAGPGPDSGLGAASILIAIGISLVNMAHVVGLTLFESVRYRGGFAKFFRELALVATPLAVLANLLILLFA